MQSALRVFFGKMNGGLRHVEFACDFGARFSRCFSERFGECGEFGRFNDFVWHNSSDSSLYPKRLFISLRA